VVLVVVVMAMVEAAGDLDHKAHLLDLAALLALGYKRIADDSSA
jgi:hypothetical protein